MYALYSASASVLKRQALRNTSRNSITQAIHVSVLPESGTPNMTKAFSADRQSSLLHRVPWRPPISVSGDGIYLVLEDGRRVIDAVGGAAVACLGNSYVDTTASMLSDHASSDIHPRSRYIEIFSARRSYSDIYLTSGDEIPNGQVKLLVFQEKQAILGNV